MILLLMKTVPNEIRIGYEQNTGEHAVSSRYLSTFISGKIYVQRENLSQIKLGLLLEK